MFCSLPIFAWPGVQAKDWKKHTSRPGALSLLNLGRQDDAKAGEYHVPIRLHRSQ